MYTLSQIRRQVDALKRKYATELTILRLRPLAEEYCFLWSEAMTDGNSPPDSYAFIRHIARQGFRLNTFTSLHLYLERCRENHRNPNTIGIVAALLPEMRPDRLEELLLDDSSDEESASGGPLAGGASPVPVASWIPSWLWNAHAVSRLLGLLPGRPHTLSTPIRSYRRALTFYRRALNSCRPAHSSNRRKPVSGRPSAQQSQLHGRRPSFNPATRQPLHLKPVAQL